MDQTLIQELIKWMRHSMDKQELCDHIISEIDQLANMLEKNDTIILDDLLERLKSYKQDQQEEAQDE